MDVSFGSLSKMTIQQALQEIEKNEKSLEARNSQINLFKDSAAEMVNKYSEQNESSEIDDANFLRYVDEKENKTESSNTQTKAPSLKLNPNYQNASQAKETKEAEEATLKEKIADLVEDISDVGGGLFDIGTDILGGVKELGSDIVDGIKETASNFAEKMEKANSEIVLENGIFVAKEPETEEWAEYKKELAEALAEYDENHPKSTSSSNVNPLDKCMIFYDKEGDEERAKFIDSFTNVYKSTHPEFAEQYDDYKAAQKRASIMM